MMVRNKGRKGVRKIIDKNSNFLKSQINSHSSGAWWFMAVIPEFGRQLCSPLYYQHCAIPALERLRQ
jgi:hypothetical protein